MKERILDCTFTLAMAILIALFVWSFTGSVRAAPDVPECEAIAVTDSITIFRCEPDEGPSFLVNSLGFMVAEE